MSGSQSCIPRNETEQPPYFQNRIIMFCLPYICERYTYILSGSVCLFCCSQICGPILGIYINRSQTHECRNWDWGHAIPSPGISVPDPDLPDLLVRGMNPDPDLDLDPDPSKFYHHAKIIGKTLNSTILWLFFDFLSLKNDVNVASKSNKQKKLCSKNSFLLTSWRSMTNIAGSGSGIRIRIRIH